MTEANKMNVYDDLMNYLDKSEVENNEIKSYKNSMKFFSFFNTFYY